MGWEVENGLGEDEAVRGDDNEIRGQFSKLGEESGIAQVRRLEDDQSKIESSQLRGRGREFATATCRSVGLSDDRDEVVLGGKGLKGWHGESGGSHKQNAHGPIVACLIARANCVGGVG